MSYGVKATILGDDWGPGTLTPPDKPEPEEYEWPVECVADCDYNRDGVCVWADTDCGDREEP